MIHEETGKENLYVNIRALRDNDLYGERITYIVSTEKMDYLMIINQR